MKQYGFHFDATRCTGCKTCVVACCDKNGLEDGRQFRHVLAYENGGWRQDRMTGAWHQDVRAWYVSIACNHCENPACVKVCPVKAIRKEDEFGAVLVDDAKCVGCRSCAAACPFGAPKFASDDEGTKMSKCTMCVDRLAEGMQPACTASCPLRAFDFGPLDELIEKYGDVRQCEGMPAPDATKPAFIIWNLSLIHI